MILSVIEFVNSKYRLPLRRICPLITYKSPLWNAVVNHTWKMSSHESYVNLDRQMSVQHVHPAADRNKEPILNCLKTHIDPDRESYLLEISSGSGQHVIHFAPHFPKTVFQPTEYELTSIRSINEYISNCPSGNIQAAEFLDVTDPANTWLSGNLKPKSVDYILNVNMIHITAWDCTEGLFAGADYLLKPGGLLFTYGPYSFNGQIKPESNYNFDLSLKARNPKWGLRDVNSQLQPTAKKYNIVLDQKYDLPANNHFLVWRRS